MKKMTKLICLIIIPLTCAAFNQQASAKTLFTKTLKTMTDTTADKQAIETILFSYQDAITTADINKVLPLYADDAQVLGAKMPSLSGLANIKEAYSGGFKVFRLDVKFKIEEIIVSGDMAYARTGSTGSMTMLSSGQKMPEENRELFVLRKKDGQWKIAVYMFNQDK